MATILNNFFTTVFNSDHYEQNRPPIIASNSENRMENITITTDEILTKIDKMKVNKSPGPDLFYPKVLKNVKHEVVSHLVTIFNKSLEQGLVPVDWKLANVTPIFKKGQNSEPGNYRPISLTSVVGKLIESIITDHVVQYLESNNLISKNQHGFRSKRSCLTNLIDFYTDLFLAHDTTKSLDIIYLDFKKAFDKVPHHKLLEKLSALGIAENVHKWIENWLCGRKQRVVINGEVSDWVPVTSGVPQGSVLGQVLFIIYINDIDTGLTNKISKFADDTKIGRAVLSEADRCSLQQDLDKIAEWSERNQMPFNIGKCQVLHVGTLNMNLNYTMNDHSINTTKQAKDLGITITDSLKPSRQCLEAANKANRALGFIARNFTYKSKQIVLPLYKSLVRPHLEYAVQFWSPYLLKDIEKLESIQCRATKLIPSLRNKPYHERLSVLDLFSLKKRRLRGQLIECFKILKGFDNINSSNLFTPAPEVGTRSNGMKLKGTRVNLDVTKNFFTFNIIDFWNSLPTDVVASTTINMFKERLDKHLKDIGIFR